MLNKNDFAFLKKFTDDTIIKNAVDYTNSTDTAHSENKKDVDIKKLVPKSKAERDGDLLFNRASKTLSELNKSIMNVLREFELLVPRMGDTDNKQKLARLNSIKMAMDFPRALISLKSVVNTLHTSHNVEGLNKVRFLLLRAEKDYTTLLFKIRKTPYHPINSWCAVIKETQNLADDIRKGL